MAERPGPRKVQRAIERTGVMTGLHSPMRNMSHPVASSACKSVAHQRAVAHFVGVRSTVCAESQKVMTSKCTGTRGPVSRMHVSGSSIIASPRVNSPGGNSGFGWLS